ncbi:MAG TPA: NUDIX domain-containing protein [Ramlibacter sp.]|nr:NUDIX domain-containing protein [Ramlibacter sp.]
MSPAVPRDAATVVVVRAAPAGGSLEVLLLQRAERGDHNSGAWVFPGGLIDPGDREYGDDAFRVAAIREAFEESGILFATDAKGDFVSLEGEPGAQLAALRHELKDGKCTLADICQRFNLRLVPERLHFIGHWLTPAGRAKRFDTRFYLAIAPQQQTAMHDAGETLDHVWIAPAEALAPTNARRLMTPTRAMLEAVRPFGDVKALGEWAASPRTVEKVLPRLSMSASGMQPVLPGHPAYHEVGKLDPDGRSDVWSELRTGVPVAIGEHVQRITGADGRNRYTVGSEEIDPAVTTRLVAEDRIVIARDAASVPAQLRAGADWLAPLEGFLQPLHAPT